MYCLLDFWNGLSVGYLESAVAEYLEWIVGWIFQNGFSVGYLESVVAGYLEWIVG